jgi:DNA-binding response OmpR family regulator|tara:strand:+ start:630 stop:986 length:357 start_codon:yes stop_codon:yes gene_type:complete
LVVDDEPNIVRSLTFVLNEGGYDVSIAGDGVQAMSVIRDSKPNILILDVMVSNMSGYGVCSEIKSGTESRDIHVVMLTTKGQYGDREATLSRGADEYISKPFSPIEILARLYGRNSWA